MRRDFADLRRCFRECGRSARPSEVAATAGASDSRAATAGRRSPPARAPDPPLSPAEARPAGSGPLPPAALRAQAESWLSGRIRRAEAARAATPEPGRGP
eukprot:4263030-Alexandrium_andersonii.AAC.1